MRPVLFALTFTLTGFFAGAAFFVAASIVLAWTGPTSAPPNGNVSAPINVGTTDQVKNGGLAINALAVFGNAIFAGVSSYLNFGNTSGSSGYGIRDNNGVIEFKNSGGSWSSAATTVLSGIQSFFATGSSNTVGQIKFADGTVQATAASSSSSSMVTGWPDAIKCQMLNFGATHTAILYLTMAPGGTDYSNMYNGKYVYAQTLGDTVNNYRTIAFNSDGSFYEDNYGPTFPDCDNKSIATLYAEGKAFNIVN